MKIEKLDKNFKKNKTSSGGIIVDVPSKFVNIYGVKYEEGLGFHRIPNDVSSKIGEFLHHLQYHTAGGRVAFSTDSKKITIHVKYPSLEKTLHMPLSAQGGFSLCEINNGKEQYFYTYVMKFEDAKGFSETSYFNKKTKMRDFVLHMPLYHKIKELKIEIEDGSIIKPFSPYKDIPPIIYYGSSITQGGCASRSDHSYQGFISKWNKIDFINLGFSGNCKGETIMAKYISSINCSAFVYDYDHNTPSHEHLKNTHEALFLEFRKRHINTPVIIISAPNYYSDPDEYEERRQIIKKTYLNAIARGDKNVYFIDGATIYPKNLRYECSVDGVHPTDLGFYFFAKKIFKILNKLKLS